MPRGAATAILRATSIARSSCCPGGGSRGGWVSRRLPGRGHVLNKTKSISLVGTPIITGQHVSHRITPACLANERDRRPASGEMTSGHFSLGEYGIARGNSYVSSEKKLVACALALALNCDN